MAAQVLGGVGMAAGIAVGALLAEDLSGSEGLAGMGTTAQVLGSALIAIPTARIMAARGRGPGLQFALLLALGGTLLIVLAATVGFFPLFLLGMLLFGGGTTANSQARYAAADLAPPHRRGRDLSMVVWATTVGSVLGPNLVGPGKSVARVLHLPVLAGTFVFSLVGFALALVMIRLLLKPDPLLAARALALRTAEPGAVHDHDGSISRGIRVIRSNQVAARGMTIMALGHFVMVSVMVMTPIHMKHGHADLEIIGFVISVHIAGMYAFSPLVGSAVDRVGAARVAAVGGLVLVAATLLATGTPAGWSPLLLGALFLLGVGWSCTFVAGSTMLAAAVSTAQRPASQGLADVVMGVAGALGGLLAGVVVDLLGYHALALCSAVIAVTVLLVALTSARHAAGTEH